VLPAANIDQFPISGVEVEVAVQLSPGVITGVAAVAPLLLGGEELGDHQVLATLRGDRMCLGIPGQIVEISDATQMRAKVDVDGVRSEVSVALLGLEGPEAARVGDWVLVHVGFAIARISSEEARATLEGLHQLRDMYEQELPDYSAGVACSTRVVLPS